MYLIGKNDTIIQGKYGIRIKLDLSKIWKVKRTVGCKAGEYALFQKADNDTGSKFSIFAGYITYDTICNEFEMIKYNKGGVVTQ